MRAGVGLRPLVKIKLVKHHVRFEQLCKRNLPFEQFDKVVLEKVEETKLVLVLHNMLDHQTDRFDLILV